MPCACGCGTNTDGTFAVGHNRRAQGILLTQLYDEAVDAELLADYVGSLVRVPDRLRFEPRTGRCMAGCGSPAKHLYCTGRCGMRFADGLLVHTAGRPVQCWHDMDMVVDHWRSRQRFSPRIRRRLSRYRALDSSTSSRIDASAVGERAAFS